MTERWEETRRRSIRHWRRVLESIGRRDALAIVAELSDSSALCEMAAEEAGGEECERCAHCVVFGDAGDCADVRLDIAAFVLNGELREARQATMAVIARIRAARPRLPGR